MDNMIYGGWILLDDILDEIEKDVYYQQAEYVFTDRQISSTKDSSVISSYVEKGKFYLSVSISPDEIMSEIADFYKIMRFGTILALLIVPLLYLLINKILILPLKVLIDAQKELMDGNLDYRISKKANSPEYEYTYESFNNMAENIRFMKIENYEKELAREKMELKNLQLQIRPHFLLNTFNLIYTLAQKEKHKDIQKIIMYLTDYFRYIFRSGKSLELFSKEQNLIEGYLEMAMVRYPGCIDVEYNYDPEIYYTRVPPLLIHNFVENIVKHAVNQKTVTHISIVGQYDAKKVTFMIMDDGVGISKEKLASLTENMHSDSEDNAHIGYKNSLRRLKYFYGEDAEITITSEAGEGTCVMIHFPYNLEVEDEIDDCQ